MLLGVLAAVFHVGAYAAYLSHARGGRCAPSPTGWALSIPLTALNAVATLLTTGNILTATQFLAGTVCSTLVCLHLLRRGRFSAFTSMQWVLIVICAAGFASAKLSHDPRVPVVAGFVALLVAALPTIRGVWLDPSREHPQAWIIWIVGSLCYVAQRSCDDIDATKYLVPVAAITINISVIVLSQNLHRRLPIIARRAL